MIRQISMWLGTVTLGGRSVILESKEEIMEGPESAGPEEGHLLEWWPFRNVYKYWVIMCTPETNKYNCVNYISKI